MTRTELGLSLLSLGLLCAALYAGSLGASFQLDDTTSIVQNRAVQELRPSSLWDFWPTRFLTYLSFALDHARAGLEVETYHVTSVTTHFLASVAVFWFAWNFLQRIVPQRRNLLAALAAAMFFAAHPLQTQAVTYVVQRAAALCTLFYVGSCATYLAGLGRREDAGDGAGRVRGWILGLAWTLGLAAQLCKEIAITLPLTLALLDVAAGPRTGRTRRLAPFALLALVVPVLAATQRSFGVAGSGLTGETESVSHLTYWFTQSEVVLRYLRLIVVPWGQNVDHHVAWRSLDPETVLFGLVNGAILAFAGWHWRRGHRLSPVAIVWFYGTLLPESSFFPIADAMFEHRLYLPMVGVALALGLLVAKVERARARTGWIALAVIVLGLGTLTVLRNRVWSTPETLWSDAVRKSPDKGRPHMALGAEYGQQGRLREARPHLARAVELMPGSAQAWTNLGNLELAAGKLAAARRAYERALALKRDHIVAWYNLAVSHDREGALEPAARAYEETISLDPLHGAACNGLAAVRLRQGRVDEALGWARRAAEAGQGAPRLMQQIERARRGGGSTP